MIKSIPTASCKLYRICIRRVNKMKAFRKRKIQFLFKIKFSILIIVYLLETSLFCLFHQKFLSIKKHKLLFVIKIRHMVYRIIYHILCKKFMSGTNLKVNICHRRFMKYKSYNLIAIKPETVQILIGCVHP